MDNLSPEEKLIQLWSTDYPLEEWLEGESCDIWCGDYYIKVFVDNARNCEYFMQDNQLHLKFTADAIIFEVDTDKHKYKLDQYQRRRFFTFDIHINVSEAEAHNGRGVERLDLYDFGKSIDIWDSNPFVAYAPAFSLDLDELSNDYFGEMDDAIYSLYSDDIEYFDW